MHTKQEILTRLQEIAGEHLGVRQDQITEESTWVQLGADSLDRLDMSLAVENAFKVDLPHSEGERLTTVGKTVDHLLILTARAERDPDIRIEEHVPGPMNVNTVRRGL